MKISAALIMKNEEENLPRLLDSLQGKFDEIVVVDTGSSDRSIKIAESYGCKVYEHTWNGFADARNYATSKCQSEWIWHFDADFELEDEEYRKFLFYFNKINSYYDAIGIKVENLNAQGQITALSEQIFIHRKHCKWKGKVHEIVDTKKFIFMDVKVKHYGYQDRDINYKKTIRNLKLLQDELQNKEHTKNITRFYIVQSCVSSLNIEEKKSYFLQLGLENFEAIEKDNFNDLDIRFKVKLLVYAHSLYYHNNNSYKALLLLHKAKRLLPTFPEISYFIAKIHLRRKKNKLAKKYFLMFLKYLFTAQKTNILPFAIERMGDVFEVVEEIFEMIDDANYEKLVSEWKLTKNPYIAMLLIRYNENKEIPDRKLLRKILMIHDKNSDVATMLMQFFLNTDRLEEARKILKKIDIEKSNELMKELAAIYEYKKGNYEQALQYFLLKRTPLSPQLLPLFQDLVKKLDL